jgi:hypothetical protein
LHLQSRRSTASAIPQVHFALVIFEMGLSWTTCLDWLPVRDPPVLTFSSR